MIILVLSVPKTSESYDEVAAGHKTRHYVGEHSHLIPTFVAPIKEHNEV
jgi:hypothetical protein